MTAQRVLAVVIVVVLVGGLLYFGGFLDLPGAPSANSMTVQYIDEQGNPISLGFYSPTGQEIHGFVATVTHQGTGSEYRLSTLYVDGLMELYTVEYAHGDTMLNLIDTHSWVSRNPSGSESHIWYFANWLDTASASSWTIRVVGHLDATVEDAYGQSVDVEPWTGFAEFDVTWEPVAGTFSITGTIDYGFP